MKNVMVKSISHYQEEIIGNIINLYLKGNDIECDPTYSKGNFYKTISKPKFKFDLKPQFKDVIEADCRQLPLESESLNNIMFDPPFLASSGKSLTFENRSNVIAKRFGIYRNEKQLHSFYTDSLKEFQRLLKKDGILIFKCQDKVSSGKQYFSHIHIYNEAIKAGFYPLDMFVLLASNRIMADWQLKGQSHARKFHCYFWVFKKSNTRINYI